MKYLICLLLACSCSCVNAQQSIVTGAGRIDVYLPLLKGKRVAMMVNQTATVGTTHLVDTLLKCGVKIVKIFSPEHGFRGIADAGEKVGNNKDEKTGLPIISLYGKHRKPDAADLRDVDIIIFDIQDVGARFFTYISSLEELMEAAAVHKKPLLVLDRPNPNGHYVDGPVLDTQFRSFIGMQPIPVVHGMTIGEYAQMLNGESWLDDQVKCNLTVITCLGYTHRTKYNLPVKPSPNLPNMAAVYLYPSTCFFEGTVFSLGRGTDKPFQVFGHPSLPKDLFAFTPRSMPGAKSPVLKDTTCYGFDLSATTYMDSISLSWLIQAYKMFEQKDKFFIPFFNKLSGNTALMAQIKAGLSEAAIRQSWQPSIGKFKKIRKKYLLYEDF